MAETVVRVDPYPSQIALDRLWLAAWGEAGYPDFSAILARALVHVGAFCGNDLVGFVHVAWDGGIHAFLLDPTVHPDHRRAGIGSRLVIQASEYACARGARWLHVDFEPHLAGFYARCGFRPSAAGIMPLQTDGRHGGG